MSEATADNRFLPKDQAPTHTRRRFLTGVGAGALGLLANRLLGNPVGKGIETAASAADSTIDTTTDIVGDATRPITNLAAEMGDNLEKIQDKRPHDGEEVEPGTTVTAKILYLASDENAGESNIRTGHVREIDNRVAVENLGRFRLPSDTNKEVKGREVFGSGYNSNEGHFFIKEDGAVVIAVEDGNGGWTSDDGPIYGKWFEMDGVNEDGKPDNYYTLMSNVEVVKRERPDEPIATPQSVK